jgi:predicted DCC family thiol-disulfide oxidoreductase YuxK
MPGGPIIFIDGECILCENSMQRIIRHDRRGLFRFATLQGSTAARLLSGKSQAELLEGVILFEEAVVSQGYPAFLRITVLLYPVLRFPVAILRLPGLFAFGRLVYALIARNRYRWFGKKDHCMLPDAGIRERLLD